MVPAWHCDDITYGGSLDRASSVATGGDPFSLSLFTQTKVSQGVGEPVKAVCKVHVRTAMHFCTMICGTLHCR